MFGSNGTVDGIGVYTTDNTYMAALYAKESGSVYVTSLDTQKFVTISDDAYFSPEQIAVLTSTLSTLPKNAVTRLATDFAGKVPHRFTEEADALACYRKALADFKEMGGTDRMPDRIKPDVDWEANHIDVNVPRETIDLTDVSTGRFHHVLNLYNNRISSEVMRSICDGLVMPKGDDRNDYLSFNTVTPMKEYAIASLSQADPAAHLEALVYDNTPPGIIDNRTPKPQQEDDFIGAKLSRY
jgi:histone H3/H4